MHGRVSGCASWKEPALLLGTGELQHRQAEGLPAHTTLPMLLGFGHLVLLPPENMLDLHRSLTWKWFCLPNEDS